MREKRGLAFVRARCKPACALRPLLSVRAHALAVVDASDRGGACISSCSLCAALCAVHKQTRARPFFLQDDEAAFESFFAQEVPVVREKQELVHQIKQANIG